MLRRKKDPHRFLTPREREEIVHSIRAAEHETSGEIRVHLDRHCPGDPLEKGKLLFSHLGMDRTARRNGVLIYLAVYDRKIAILGDEEIHRLVPENFWEDVLAGMRERFARREFCAGLTWGIEQIGHKLKEVFPWSPTDKDELPDAISTEDT